MKEELYDPQCSYCEARAINKHLREIAPDARRLKRLEHLLVVHRKQIRQLQGLVEKYRALQKEERSSARFWADHATRAHAVINAVRAYLREQLGRDQLKESVRHFDHRQGDPGERFSREIDRIRGMFG